MPLIRSDLRLALTAGLANAFATLSPLPFGIYMPLAVLAVCSGTLGGSMLLGQQRILGSLLGMALLILGLNGLEGIPFPLAIALILGTLRLFWTVAGILLGVLSMRLLWPARALPRAWRNPGAMLGDIARSLDQVADQLEQPTTGAITGDGPDGSSPVQALRQQLGVVRGGWIGNCTCSTRCSRTMRRAAPISWTPCLRSRPLSCGPMKRPGESSIPAVPFRLHP